jgi:hypothetical protein
VCTTTAVDILRALRAMFAREPVYNACSIFDRLARDQVDCLRLRACQSVCVAAGCYLPECLTAWLAAGTR